MPSARTEPEDPSLPLNRPNTLPPFGWAPDLKQTSKIVSAGPQIKDLSLNAHISFQNFYAQQCSEMNLAID